jgi:hypothetical protein
MERKADEKREKFKTTNLLEDLSLEKFHALLTYSSSFPIHCTTSFVALAGLMFIP